MIDINDFLEEFTEEQKQDFYSFYDAINEYFGGNQADFFYMPEGYDAWFIKEVIFPEREKILKEKIAELLMHPDSLLPEVTEQLTDETKSKLDSFYSSNDELSIRTINAMVNAVFVETLSRSKHPESVVKPIDPNYAIEKLMRDNEELMECLNHYNELAFAQEEPTYLDLYKSNDFFKNLTTILSE